MKKTNSNRPSKYRRLSQEEKLKVVTNRKKRGDVTRVAEITNKDTGHVSRVLRGKTEDERILNAAYNIARGRKPKSNSGPSQFEKISFVANTKKRGDVKRIAELLKVDNAFVSRVLNGKVKNERVLDMAYSILKKRSTVYSSRSARKTPITVEIVG